MLFIEKYTVTDASDPTRGFIIKLIEVDVNGVEFVIERFNNHVRENAPMKIYGNVSESISSDILFDDAHLEITCTRQIQLLNEAFRVLWSKARSLHMHYMLTNHKRATNIQRFTDINVKITEDENNTKTS